MSKTWRRGDGERCGRPEAHGTGRVGIDYTRRSEQPEVITPEWAVGRMTPHVNYVLSQMIMNGEFLPRDKEDYASMINFRICQSLPGYKAEPRMGRGASIVHYLTNVVSHEVNHIRMRLSRQMRSALTLPIMLLPEKDKAASGYVSAGAMSDGCRSVNELVFKMDVNDLRGMMTAAEAEVFDLRMRDMTREEIMAELRISKHAYLKTMASVRRKARRCGFIPPSEVRPKASGCGTTGK